MVGGAGAVVLALVAAVVLVGDSGEDEQQAAAGAEDAVSLREGGAEERLLATLPSTVDADRCEGVEPADNVVAQVVCDGAAGRGGPDRVSYMLLADGDSLAARLDSAVSATAIEVCPGRIQSPGPWRRNASPERVAGTVFCGSRDGVAVMGWSDVDRLVFAEISSSAAAPTPQGLYDWWSRHS